MLTCPHLCGFRISSCFTEKTGQEQNACGGETQRKTKPDAERAEPQRKSEQIAGRYGNNDVGNERIPHQGLYVFNRAEGVGKEYLGAVAKLVDAKWK